MPSPILLPAPLASASMVPGQLIVDPLNPEYNSFVISSASSSIAEPIVQASYQDLIAHDDEGRLISSLSSHPHSQDNVVLIKADQISYTSLKNPTSSFHTLGRSPLAQSFIRTIATQSQPLYYITGIQKLKNPTFHKATVKDQPTAASPTSPSSKIPLPIHARRDSALDVGETSNEAVFGVELRKVRCHIGPRNQPHSVEDIEYSWTYHEIGGEEDVQLSIGLGKALKADELRALVGIESDEDVESDCSEEDSFDDEGLAGF